MVNKITKLLLLPLCAAAVLGAAVGCGGTSSSEPEFDVNSNPTVEGFDMWVVGSAWASWEPKNVNDSLKFSKSNGSAALTYTVTITNAADEAYWGFKFIGQKSWSPSQYGMEDIDYENCNEAFKTLVKDYYNVKNYTEYKAKWHEGTSNRSNVQFGENKDASGAFTHLGAGTYKITYNPANFDSVDENDTTYSHKFVVEFTKAA